MKQESTATRLQLIMKDRGLKQVDILEMAKPYCQEYNVKLGKNDLSQYVNGKVEPGQEKLTILGLTLGVSEVWLMGYDVSMERDTYNWDIDEEYRLSSIPPNEWDSLLSKHNGSKQRAWEEWWDICAQLFLDGLSAKFNHGEPLEEMTNMETIAILNEDEEKRELNHSQIKQLITSFRSLDEEGKNKVLSYIEDIAPKHKTDK